MALTPRLIEPGGEQIAVGRKGQGDRAGQGFQHPGGSAARHAQAADHQGDARPCVVMDEGPGIDLPGRAAVRADPGQRSLERLLDQIFDRGRHHRHGIVGRIDRRRVRLRRGGFGSRRLGRRFGFGIFDRHHHPRYHRRVLIAGQQAIGAAADHQQAGPGQGRRFRWHPTQQRRRRAGHGRNRRLAREARRQRTQAGGQRARQGRQIDGNPYFGHASSAVLSGCHGS
jgi:hypothetical protein